MSRKKSLLRFAPGAKSVGASSFSRPKSVSSAAHTSLALADVAQAHLLEVRQLLEELLEAEIALQLPEKAFEGAVQRAARAQCVAEQTKARRHQRLLLGDRGGGVVVGARVGDAAPEHVAVLVDHHRLGGGGAQIDADEGLHGQCIAAPWIADWAAVRFCLIIWK